MPQRIKTLTSPLFEKRISAWIMKSRVWTNLYVPGMFATWPMSKIQLFDDYLIIKIAWKEFIFKYTDIDYLERKWLTNWIHHHNPAIDQYVWFSGLNWLSSHLLNDIKKVIVENNLNLKVKS